jgi:hypothetical protein
MDQTPAQRPRAMFAFWVAAALAASGGIGPLLLAGLGSRVTGVAIPFLVAAVAYAICTRMRPQGRGTATALYFVGGLAIVYGMLFLVAIPLRVAVLGACLPQPSPCAAGAERALTDGESTSIAFGIAFGMVAILVGFFGLASLYRRRALLSAATPPVRRIAPVVADQPGGAAAAPAEVAAAPAEAAAAPPVAADEPPSVPVVPVSSPASEAEPEAVLELSAPEEALELPPPTPEGTPELPPPAPVAAPESHPQGAERKPRRRRAPKPPPEDPTPPSSDA